MKPQEQHLTERDLEILQFVLRYRAATDELIGKVFFPEDGSFENVQRVRRRLVRRGLLRKIKCRNGFSYLVPTRRSLRLLKQTPRSPRSLTEQSLPNILAIAFYCAENRLERMTNKEFSQLYPELWRPGLKSANYVLIGNDEDLKLEMLLVDRGGAARRVREKTRRVIAQRKGLPSFVALMESGQFQIRILTATPEQEDKIKQRIDGTTFAPVAVVTSVVPELSDILI